MNGYRFELLCVRCGSELHHVSSDPPIAPDRATGSAFCCECGIGWRVDVAVTAEYVPAVFDEAAARLRAGEALGNEALSAFQ